MLRQEDNLTFNQSQIFKGTSKSEYTKSRTAKSANYLSMSSTFKEYSPELRCVKHSARITSSRYCANLENHQFEKMMWQQTFDAMGGLPKLKLKEYKPFTTLNKAPYHCCSLARSYNVKYGKISHVEGGSVKGTIKPVKETKLISFCKFIEPILAADGRHYERQDYTLQQFLNTAIDNPVQTVLNFGVVVWWNDDRYSAETVCEWLQRFGNLLFTFYVSKSTMTAFFENLKSAHRAVNYPQNNIGIRLTWNDARLNNYSYYRLIENTNLNTDQTLINLLSRRYKVQVKGGAPNVKSILQARLATMQNRDCYLAWS